MELVKKMEESCRDFLKGIRSMEMKESVLTGSVQGLEEKKTQLEKNISVLEEKQKTLAADVDQERAAKLAVIDGKHDDILKKEKVLMDGITFNQMKAAECEVEKENMIKAKNQYEKLYAEYEIKIAEIKDKRERLNAVLG